MLHYFYYGKLFFLSKAPNAVSSKDPEQSIEMDDIKNSSGYIIAQTDTLQYIDDDKVSEAVPLLHVNEDDKKEVGIDNMATATTPGSQDDKKKEGTDTMAAATTPENQTISAATFPQADQDDTKNKVDVSTSSESDDEKTKEKAASISSESDKEETQSTKETAETSAVG